MLLLVGLSATIASTSGLEFSSLCVCVCVSMRCRRFGCRYRTLNDPLTQIVAPRIECRLIRVWPSFDHRMTRRWRDAILGAVAQRFYPRMLRDGCARARFRDIRSNQLCLRVPHLVNQSVADINQMWREWYTHIYDIVAIYIYQFHLLANKVVPIVDEL